MSSNTHNEKEFVQEQYEQMIRAHQEDDTILVSHYGELSQSVISNLEGSVEEKITSLDISKGPIKKIFFIQANQDLNQKQKRRQNLQRKLVRDLYST